MASISHFFAAAIFVSTFLNASDYATQRYGSVEAMIYARTTMMYSDKYLDKEKAAMLVTMYESVQQYLKTPEDYITMLVVDESVSLYKDVSEQFIAKKENADRYFSLNPTAQDVVKLTGVCQKIDTAIELRDRVLPTITKTEEYLELIKIHGSYVNDDDKESMMKLIYHTIADFDVLNPTVDQVIALEKRLLELRTDNNFEIYTSTVETLKERFVPQFKGPELAQLMLGQTKDDISKRLRDHLIKKHQIEIIKACELDDLITLIDSLVSVTFGIEFRASILPTLRSADEFIQLVTIKHPSKSNDRKKVALIKFIQRQFTDIPSISSFKY